MQKAPQPFTFRSQDGLSLVGDREGPRGAQPVVLLHGGGQTRHSWGAAQRELATRGYDVVNLDARGHGESQWASNPSQYALSYLAADIQTVIDSLPNPPVLVGASMGGLAAMTTIGLNPQAASALILVDIVPRVEQSGSERILQFMRGHPDGFASVQEAAASVAAYNPHRPPPKSLDGLRKNLRPMGNGRLRWHWDPQMIATGENAQFHSPDLMLAACRRFTRPALLVRGMHSDIVSESGIAELSVSLPQLELFDVAAAGHMIAGEKNDLFNEALLQFMQKHLPV